VEDWVLPPCSGIFTVSGVNLRTLRHIERILAVRIVLGLHIVNPAHNSGKTVLHLKGRSKTVMYVRSSSRAVLCGKKEEEKKRKKKRWLAGKNT